MSTVDHALLCTADGETFRGRSVGAAGVTTGEAVFNTSMTGYQEILTDPSYAGQVVVMTSSHIGNYGVFDGDDQSSRPAVSGFVVRSMSRRPSNWRSQGALGDYLRGHGVVAIADVDTRRLTRHIRDRGAMPVALGVGVDEAELLEMAASAPSMVGRDLASSVTTAHTYTLNPEGERRGRVVAIDLGMKRDILANLTGLGFEVDVVPAGTGADHVLALSPDGVFVSNGPGDPEPLETPIETLRGLLGRCPSSGSASVIRSSASPSAPAPTSSPSGTTVAITRCGVSRTARSRSRLRTTGLPSTCGHSQVGQRRRDRVWPVPTCSPASWTLGSGRWCPPIRTSMTGPWRGCNWWISPPSRSSTTPNPLPAPRRPRPLRPFRTDDR